MIENDLVECVISLGKNLFYNSTMESCLLITRNTKPKKRQKKIIFIDARKEIKNEKTISFLLEEHISKIYESYYQFKNVNGFSYIAELDEIIKKDYNLNVPLYVNIDSQESFLQLDDAFNLWVKSNNELNDSMTKFLKFLK